MYKVLFDSPYRGPNQNGSERVSEVSDQICRIGWTFFRTNFERYFMHVLQGLMPINAICLVCMRIFPQVPYTVVFQ